MNLQMVRPGVFRRGDESHRLWMARVAHIDDRIAVAEHVSDEGVSFVQDDLHAIGPAALVAAAQKPGVLGRRCCTHLQPGQFIAKQI